MAPGMPPIWEDQQEPIKRFFTGGIDIALEDALVEFILRVPAPGRAGPVGVVGVAFIGQRRGRILKLDQIPQVRDDGGGPVDHIFRCPLF